MSVVTIDSHNVQASSGLKKVLEGRAPLHAGYPSLPREGRQADA